MRLRVNFTALLFQRLNISLVVLVGLVVGVVVLAGFVLDLLSHLGGALGQPGHVEGGDEWPPLHARVGIDSVLLVRIPSLAISGPLLLTEVGIRVVVGLGLARLLMEGLLGEVVGVQALPSGVVIVTSKLLH